jgi:hypothetical protein
MLYDPKWEQKTKADPFSLDSLIAWLEQQPAENRYCYADNGKCLLGRYFTAKGFKAVNVWSSGVSYQGGDAGLPPHFNDIAVYTPHTFGAALERARAARAS